MRRLALLAALAPLPAAAAPLSLVKASTTVADGVSGVNPKAIPGAAIDYTLIVTNPIANVGASVGGVTVIDAVPAAVKLRVADLGASGSGPVEFVDGALLGLAASRLTYSFASLASTADGIDFSADGVSWTYVPVPDASGCDARVRAVRVRLSGNQAAASSFRLRFRVMVR